MIRLIDLSDAHRRVLDQLDDGQPYGMSAGLSRTGMAGSLRVPIEELRDRGLVEAVTDADGTKRFRLSTKGHTLKRTGMAFLT